MPDIATTALSLIDLLYDAVGRAEAWPPFLEALARATNGIVPGVFLADLPTDTYLFHASGMQDPQWGAAYEAYFKERDPRRARIKELTPGTTFVGSTLLPDRDLERTEFYNDFLRPQGYYHLLGGVPLKHEDVMALVRVVRPRTAPPFGAREVAVFRSLLPHMARALRLQEQLVAAESRRDEAGAVLDRFPGGVFLLGASGRLLAANRSASQLLDAADGLRITRGVLRATVPLEAARLERLVARAGAAPALDETGEGVLNVSRRSPLRPLNLLVASLRAGALRREACNASVVVFITDPERPVAMSIGRVQRWLGLTHAEAALVVELVRGLRVEEAADTLHISTNTARTQLKRALAKTGTGRQAELLRLALGTPGALSS